ncbi:hypothetical protein Lser_V15G03846 [Lactuca serriola]
MFSSTLLCLVLLHAVGALGFPETLKLERSFPTNHGVELKQITESDGLRHHRILHKYADTNVVVRFRVYGTYDPFDVGVLLSGVFWEKLSYLIFMEATDCGSVANPVNLSLHRPHYKYILITIYDPTNSSTSSAILCYDERCSPKSNSCSDNQCTYDLHYGDGSGTSAVARPKQDR